MENTHHHLNRTPNQNPDVDFGSRLLDLVTTYLAEDNGKSSSTKVSIIIGDMTRMVSTHLVGVVTMGGKDKESLQKGINLVKKQLETNALAMFDKTSEGRS